MRDSDGPPDRRAQGARSSSVRAVSLIALLLILAMTAPEAGAKESKGSGPTSAAAGFGSLWIGFGSGEVVRLDPSTGERLARYRGAGFVHGLAATAGAIWAISSGGVTRIDPFAGTTRELADAAPADWSEGAAGAGGVWVVDADSNELLRIDPHRLKIAARVRVSGRAWGVAAGTRQVLVLSVPHSGPVTGPAGTRVLRRLDPTSGRFFTARAQLRCDAGMAVGLGAAWTLDSCTGSLSRRDLRTLRVERQQKLRVLSQTPALGFGSIWLASRSGVRRIDPRTLQTVAVIPVHSLTVFVGDAAVWAFDPVHNRLNRIDPRTNRRSGKTIVISNGS
jgi:hypothetical protein